MNSSNISHASITSEFPEPVAIQRNIPEIFQIFQNVQFNTIQHKKYCKELRKLFHKIDQDAFAESFTNALHYLFTFGEANGNVDRVLQFVANFCATLNDGEEFLHFVFGVLFDCVSVSGQGVRSRACQLLGLILSALGDDASLDDDLCDKILNTQLERLQDVRGAVRCRAVLALQRLQNPSDEDDPVSRAYTFHMSCDPSAAVRRGVILGLAKCPRNLLHILERLCDVDESVRKAAFLYVSSINVTQLKVRQRVHILKVGLTERSPRVRRVVETALLPGWLGAYHGNVLELLAAIRLDNLQGAKDSAIVAGNLLQALFKHQQMSELLEWLPIDSKVKLITADQLTKESAWYWRHLVRHLHSHQDDHLDDLLPELVIFTGYVRALIESLCPNAAEQPVEFSRRQYVLQELFSIFPVYDMADEVGRNALQLLLYDALTGNHGPLEADVIRAIMRAIDLVVPDVKKRIEFVAGIISEIHEPTCEVDVPLPATPLESTETKIMRAELRVALNEAQEEQEDAVRAQNFALAGECKNKVDALQSKLTDLNINLKDVAKQSQPVVEMIREKRNDPETLNKCLMILNMLLDTPDITSLTPVLQSLFQNFEVDLYQKLEIRENALQTVALYSMLDEEFAKEQKAFFFAQFIDMDNEKLLVTALKSVIDVICIHGVKMFNMQSEIVENEDSSEEKQLSNNSVNKSKRKSKMNKSSKQRKSQANDIWGSDSESEEADDNEAENEGIPNSPSTHDTIIELFLRLMNSECSEYRFVVVEGLCRLLMAERLSSASLISRLLLLWFNPATEDEDGLKQVLGTFFPLFAANTDGGQEQLEAAFLPTVITLANAPLGSPLAEVDHEAVLKFIIGLTMPSVAPSAHNVHPNLAVLIVSALERGEEMAALLLCRALALLSPPRVPTLCRDLMRSTNELMETFTDKILYRNLARFHATLSIALENLEQRASAANPGLEVLSEGSEPNMGDLNTSNAGSVRSSTKSDNDAPRESEPDARTSPASVESEDLDMNASGSSKSDNGAKGYNNPPSPPGNIKRITAADVARRALIKTPRRKTRNDFPAESPSATPSRALEPLPRTPPSTRRSARNASTAKKSQDVGSVTKEVQPSAKGKAASAAKGRGGRKKNKDEDDERKSKAVRGLGNELEQVSLKEDVQTKPKGKPKQKFEIFETKKGQGKKATGRKGTGPSKAHETIDKSSDSSDYIIEESSDDDDTILHTICHDAFEPMSILNNSSSEDEEENRPNIRAASNMTVVPETSESSDESDSSEEEVIQTSQKRLKRK